MRATAGHTQQTSVGYLVTRDTASVRHEKTRAEQTREVIEQPYAPLPKQAARSASSWRATLLLHPGATIDDIDRLERQLAQLAGVVPAASRGRSTGSHVRRIFAGIASLPDQGNVKANREQAVRLGDKPCPNKLRKKPPFPHAPTPAGYAAMGQYAELLDLQEREKQVALLRQETRELVEAFADIGTLSFSVFKGTGLRQAAAGERQRLMGAMAANREAPGDALAQYVAQCDDGAAGIAAARKEQARRAGLGMDTTPVEAQLAVLHADLRAAEERRDVALGLQAQLVTEPIGARLQRLNTDLDRHAAGIAQQRAQAAAMLQASHANAIEDALSARRGLAHLGDGKAVRSFLETRLAACIDTSFNATRHAMPPPMVVDIYIGALASVAQGGKPLDDAIHAKALDVVASLPGGLLALEQIRGEPIADKQVRIAHRVEALARTTLDRTAPGARTALLALAANTAARVKKRQSPADCSELERASYNAVRNAFATAPDGGAGIDPRLTAANARLEKMLTSWIENAADSGHGNRNVVQHKTPFNARTLALAARTSTLGYDDPARPMLRMDTNTLDAIGHLRTLIARPPGAIAPGSLTRDEVFGLGAVLLAADRSRAAENLRPGHVELARADDVMALLALVQRELGALLQQDGGALDLRSASSFVQNQTSNPLHPDSLVRLVGQLTDKIDVGADDYAAREASTQLLKHVSNVRDLAATHDAAHIDTLDALYDFLAPRIQQLELRGKLKASEGGNLGLSTKALAWPLSLDPGTLSVVLPVRGEIKGNRSRFAVFEMGFSTTGFEIFVGSETRTSAALGAGAGVRIGYASVLGSGGGIDKTVTSERADTEGVWLRIPRDGDDERTREQALGVLRTLLGRDDGPRGAAPDGRIGRFMEQDGVAVMPRLIGELLARHPNLSVSTTATYQERNLRNEVAASAALVSVGTGTGEHAGRFQLGAAGLRSERRTRQYHQSDETGFMQMTRSNRLSGGNAWGQAAALQIGGVFGIDADDHAGGSAGPGFGGLGVQRQLAESGVDTKLRYITRDGETNPVDTRVDYEDVNIDNHLARVAARLDALVALGAEQLFLKDAAQVPLHERKRVARQWLASILQQAAEKSQGNSRHVFSISHCMKASPAAVLDGLSAKAALARLHGNEAEARRAELERDALLQLQQIFTLWKVTTSERTSETHQLGLSFGGTYARSQKTEGQRGTSSYPK